MCNEESETMEHFVNCVKYGEPFDGNWTNIYDENSDQQFLIEQFILKRCRIRELSLSNKRMARPRMLAPLLLGLC